MSNRTYRGHRGSHGNSYRSNNYRGGNNRRGPSKQNIDPAKFIKKATQLEERVYTPKNTFADFKLHPQLHKNLEERDYNLPTAIQDQGIPHALDGKDLIGLANTGTGKTGAFLIPLINKLAHNPNQQIVVIAPTRELALQIQDEFRLFSKGLNLYSTLIIGGASMHQQISSFKRGAHAVIGTPGRMKDLLERRAIHLDKGNSIVLDEVDRMVDMGFINDIKNILGQLPKERQSLFLAATTSPQVESIMRNFMDNPVKISVVQGATADSVEQNVVRIQIGEDKAARLSKLLEDASFEKVLVFGETKRGVEKLSKDLSGRGHKTVTIHGNKSQSQRQRALRQFRDSHANIMIATDVAARGLDIDDITHVINFDTPQTYDDYVHRIGRAGRAGRQGYALTFV